RQTARQQSILQSLNSATVCGHVVPFEKETAPADSEYEQQAGQQEQASVHLHTEQRSLQQHMQLELELEGKAAECAALSGQTTAARCSTELAKCRVSQQQQECALEKEQHIDLADQHLPSHALSHLCAEWLQASTQHMQQMLLLADVFSLSMNDT